MGKMITKIISTTLFIIMATSISASAKTVELSWDPSPSSDVAGYKIYYNNGSSNLPLDGTGAVQGDSPVDVNGALTASITGLADNQTHYFAVTAYDSSGSESIYSNMVTSSPVVVSTNHAPVLAAIGSKGVAEISNLNFVVSASDSDGDNLTFSASNLPSGATFNADSQTFNWTPNTSQSGSYVVTFSVSDGRLIDSESVTITVSNYNRSPVLSSIGNKTVIENSNLSFVVNASDVDGDSLTYGASNLPSGASFNASSKTFNWTPGFSQSGSYVVAFSVSDGNLSDSESVTIAVGNSNQSPVLTSIGSKSVVEGDSLEFIISGSDSDGENLIYSASTLPSGANFNAASKTFSWIPDFSQSGTYAVTFSVTDGSLSDAETVTITVGDTNRAPILSSVGSKTVAENSNLNFAINASDADGDSLIYSASNLPVGAIFNTVSKTFNWVPTSSQAGNYVVTFSVTDGILTDSEMVAINVGSANQAPVLNAISAQGISEGGTLSVAVSASDADADSLTYSASNLPSGAVFNSETKLFSWTPDYSQSGLYSVSFHVSDGSLSASTSVVITVMNINRTPVLSPVGNQSVMENSTLNFTISGSDSDGGELTFSASNLPSGATFTPSNKTFKWVPNSTQAGLYSVTFSVSDGSVSDSETITISVEDNASLDSDGDGIADSADAFPQDPSEWVDTDQDGVGNNSDPDDDNDGINDEADSSPLDDTVSAWIINAVAGEGGTISPSGNSLLDYGSAQIYAISASAGYFLSDVFVDGNSVGPVTEYIFVAVDSHHSIEAVFQISTDGLSFVETETGLPGVDRIDGGNDSNNYVNGIPKGDLDYIFRIVMQESATGELPDVMLVLNGYAYQMNYASGDVKAGATYAYTTRLGPASSQAFHFETRDSSGNIVSRFPADYELEGPQVELMNGKNVVGVPGKIDSQQLFSVEALGSSLSYRWIPSEKRNGSYQRVDTGAPVTAGEGYVIKRTTEISLPSIESLTVDPPESYSIPVKAGWNLIANPYGGNVSLADVQLQTGASEPMNWSEAVAGLHVVDGMYYYVGKDWGNSNVFEIGSEERDATLIPRIGYWIYVNVVNEPASLIISKPLQ